MKKILLTAGFFHPHKGGSERYIKEISCFISKKYDVTILATNTEKSESKELLGDVEVIRLPATTLFSGSYPLILPMPSFFILFFHVLRKRYDIIITNTRFFETTFLAYFMSLFLGIPLIHLEHGSCHVMYRNGILEKVAHLVDHAFGWFLLKRAKKVGAVSDSSSEFLRHLGCRREIEIIPNFVDTGVFKKMDSRKIGLTVTYVGRIVQQKGLDELLNVWERILDRYDARLLVVGEGEERERLESRKLKNVFFFGESDASQISEILSMTDIFVNPSHAEGLPSSILEACACGLPVVATDVGGTRDLVEQEWLVPPRDEEGLLKKILILFGSEEKRREVGERNFKWVIERYSLDVVGKKFERFIE